MLDPRKKVLTLAEEFKAFALKGNVVDLAVAVIIGTAFNKVVDSLVKNVLMPLINAVVPSGHDSYTKWSIPLWADKTIPIGSFFSDVANFLIVSLALFFLIRIFLAWLLSLHQGEAVAATPPLTRDQELLSEIRDLLKKEVQPSSPAAS